MDDSGGREVRAPGPAWLSEPSRIALMFAAMYWITGISTPYLPVWLESRGIGLGEIGVLTIMPQLVRLLGSPLIGFEADRRRAHRELVIGSCVLGFAAWLWLTQSAGFTAALVGLVFVAAANTSWPLVESIAMAGVRARGHDYGRMRLWGSVSFVAANLVGGWVVGQYGNGAAIWLMMAGAAACLTASLLLPVATAADMAALARRPLSWADARDLLAVQQMPLLLLAAGALQGAHGMFYAYGTLHWQAQGIDARWLGLLWALGLITEIALFWWSARVIRALGATGLLLVGAGVSVFRWVLMGFDPPLAVLLPLQVLHGITFGASHLGVMHALAEITPSDRTATAQALYSVVAVIGIIIATAVASRAYPLIGGRVYLAMAAMALVGLAAAELMRRRRATGG
jgi:MFS transporter, PPP family, 3-phenylpropionic acid transporter